MSPAVSSLVFKRSLTGKRWEASPADDRVALALRERHNLSDIVARILVARGVEIDFAEAFLNPSLKSLLPDPSLLKGMDEAADRLARAVVGGETIGVFGDYDVDGATSAALLKRFILAVGGNVDIYVPDRIKRGIRAEFASAVADEGRGRRCDRNRRLRHHRLRSACRCGRRGHRYRRCRSSCRRTPITGRGRGCEPEPYRRREWPGSVGRGWRCISPVVALNRCLRERGHYAAKAEPNLLQWLDLVALGTVCDVVPLTGLNRALVAQGLKVMARREQHRSAGARGRCFD